MIVTVGAQTIDVQHASYGQIAQATQTVTAEHSLEQSTEEIVRSYFSDIPIMVQIARCESHFRHTLPDGSVLHGRIDPADTGVMQINKRYHAKTAHALGIDLNTLEGNLTYARYLYDREGTRPWNASKQCWSSAIAMR